MTKQIEIDFKPREWQRWLLFNSKRFIVVVAHRRAGKTVGSVAKLMGHPNGKGALNTENGVFAFIAPFKKQAKEIAWGTMKQYVKNFPTGSVKIYESETKIELWNGSKILVTGGKDDPDALRGLWFNWVVLDEYADMPKELYDAIINPALSDKLGWCTFIGTPKGQNAFYDLYMEGLNDPDFDTTILRASETGIIHPDELARLKRKMSPEKFMQEYECSFTSNIKGVIYGQRLEKCEKDGRRVKDVYNPRYGVTTFWDLGMNDSMSIIMVQLIKWEIRIIDSYQNNQEWLEHYAKVLKARGYRYDKHYFPHDAKVKELSGNTRIETARKYLGNNCYIVPRYSVADWLEAGRNIFNRCVFDFEKTKDLWKALNNYIIEFNEATNEYKDNPKHNWASHYADAFRYLALTYRKMTMKGGELIVRDYSDMLY